MENPSKEARILLALQAIKSDNKLSIEAASRYYKVPPSTLRNRPDGWPAQRDILANSCKLTDLEEHTIIQYIIKLCTRAFHPQLCYVEDMANRLLRKRDTLPVGKRWAYNFIKRQLELQTRLSRKYDWQLSQVAMTLSDVCKILVVAGQACDVGRQLGGPIAEAYLPDQ